MIFSLNKQYRGGILVEFAIAFPVLIGILFFITDVPNYYRWKRKINNTSYFAASMFQTLAKTPKKITTPVANYEKFVQISQSIAKSISVVATSSSNASDAKIVCEISVLLVIGIGNNKVNILKEIHLSNFNGIATPISITGKAQIPSDLIIKTGDKKVIFQLALSTTSANIRRIFGFLMMVPKPSLLSSAKNGFFRSNFVFSPHGGLFEGL